MSLNNMLSIVTHWFEDETPTGDYKRSDYVFLWLILAVGAIARFWGLDNVGLHGDEETMAMPAMAILETGEPILPSGMYYPRALINIYLMSGSVWLFGETEWALRLPSAVIGSLTGLAAFFLGRRFLPPTLNLAFVTTIALLPGLIAISQTARMYVFFVTCAIWFCACIFRWEHDQRVVSLIIAFVVWTLCLHFHKLAIFVAPLFLYPGISRASWSQLWQGIIGFLIAFLLFVNYNYWISTKYPQSSDEPPPLESVSPLTSIDVLLSSSEWLIVISIALIGMIVGFLLTKKIHRGRFADVAPILLMGVGLTMIAFLQYHLGGIFLILGMVFWLRSSDVPKKWLLLFLLAAALMTAFHLSILSGSGLYPGRKIIGALVGIPSIWPILRFLEYSVFAGIIYSAVMLIAIKSFSRGQRLPMSFLYFSVAVWAPLLIIGLFRWDIPPRYTQGQLGFFLLCVFAGSGYVFQKMGWMAKGTRPSRLATAAIVIIVIGIINPFSLVRAINPGYEQYPDHKGAAEFIKNLNLAPSAILIAEDVLQQTYYLGSVDYWLREKGNSHRYSVIKDGHLVDRYTGAVTIGTGAELEAVLEQNPNSEVFVIGSGENFVDEEPIFRGSGISDVLESGRFDVVYTGRDGKTKIWKRVN